MSNITEIQRLLNEKADLQAQINISAFDGSIEVKTVNDQKYIYVRKREAGKYKSNYIDKYSEELYALAVNQTYIYPVAHPGYWGTSTRGEDNVIADWRRIRK